MAGLNAVDGQLVAPATAGHTRWPSTVGSFPGSSFGTPVAADAAGPCQILDERFGEKHFAGGAVQDVEKPVAVAVQKEFPRRPTEGRVDQHRRLSGVPIVKIVRSELVMPLQFSGRRVQGEDRRRVEIVAFPFGAIVIGTRVASGPVTGRLRRGRKYR